jgi:hypothetical protein
MAVTSVTGSLTDHGVDCSDDATRIAYLANNRLDAVDSMSSKALRRGVNRIHRSAGTWL